MSRPIPRYAKQELSLCIEITFFLPPFFPPSLNSPLFNLQLSNNRQPHTSNLFVTNTQHVEGVVVSSQVATSSYLSRKPTLTPPTAIGGKGDYYY